METKLTEILQWLQEYKEHTNCKGVVLGISGGKDSSVVAMLAKKVWGNNVFGVLMPNGIQADINDSLQIVKTLGIKHRVVNIEKAYQSLIQEIEYTEYMDSNGLPDPQKDGIPVTDKSKTNIPPRLRMTVLYAIAQSLGYRVIGTGNMSEGYIGWCTKWGDTACDLNPLATVACTEVVELGKLLAKEFGLDERLIIKTPADGLSGKSDEDNFGFSYATLDAYILGGAQNIDYNTALKIEQMHTASEHKRNMPVTLE